MRDDAGRVLPAQITTNRATPTNRTANVFVATVPPLGYRVYRYLNAEAPDTTPAGSLVVEEYAIENDRVRVEIDPESGHIARLVDKSSGLDVLAGPGAVFQGYLPGNRPFLRRLSAAGDDAPGAPD